MRLPSRQASLTTIALALLATLTALGFATEASAGTARITVSGAPVAPNDFRISDMGTDGTAGTFPAQSIPALAYNSSADQYLAVWSGRDGADGVDRIYGQLVNARTGADAGPNDFLIGENTGQPGTSSQAPAVAYNSAQNEFLVVWNGDDVPDSVSPGDAHEIYAQRVSAAGSLIGGRFRVSSMGASDTATSLDAFDPGLAYNPATNEYLVVWEGDDNTAPLVANEMEIFAQRLGFSGGNLVEVGSDDQRISTVGLNGDPAPRGMDPAVAYNSVNNEYLVVWDGEDIAPGFSELYGQRLDAAGAEIGVDDFRIDNPSGGDEVNDPAITYNPTANEYLVLWQGEQGDGYFRLYAQIVAAATGAQVGDDVLITDNTTSNLENVYYPQADYNPALNEYLVVWHGEDASGFGLAPDKQEIFGRRYSPTLATVEAPFLISDMGPAGDVSYAAQTPAVAYSEASINGYMVIWRGDDNVAPLVNEEFEIFGQLVAPNANLTVTKSTATPERTIGQNVSYTVSYSNAGPDPILGATLTDLLPPELTPLSCAVNTFTGTAPVLRAPASCTFDIARLNSGQGGTITVVGTLNPTGANGQVVNNTATMDATTLYFDSNSANNSATASFTVAEPVLDLAKTLLTSAAAVDAGDNVRYQIQVAHRQSPAANFSRAGAYNLQLSDTLPASLTGPTIVSAIVSDGATSTNVSGSFTIAGGTLQTSSPLSLLLNTNGANDQVLTIVVQGRVADSIAPASTINNSAAITWRNETGFQRASYSATGAAPTITAPGALDVSKSAAPTNPAPGDTVTFTLTTAVVEGTTTSLRFVDTLPAGLSYVPGSAAVASANGMTIGGFAAAIAGQTLTIDIASVLNPGNADNPAAVDSDSFIISYQATVDAGVANGAALTNSVAATASGGLSDPNTQATVTVDVPPRVVSIARAGPDPTNAASVAFTVTFSEPVTGGAAANFELNTTGTIAGASVGGVSGSGATRTVTVNTGSGDGTIRLDLTGAAGIADSAGKALIGLPFASGAAYTIDKTAPLVTVNQAPAQADPTNASPINFHFVFSEPINVASFIPADVSINGTAGPTTVAISEIAPNNGTAFNVALSGMTGNGSVTASMLPGGVSDLAGNSNTASTSADSIVTYDISQPNVTVNQMLAQPDPANAGPIAFRVAFSEQIDVSSFTSADVTLGGTAGPTTVTISEITPNNGTTFEVAVSGMTGDGTVTASIAAGVVSDPTGNGNIASGSIDNTVTYDATAPTVTIEQAAGQADPASAGPILFEVTFSEPVTGFTGADVVLGGAAGATTAVVSGSGASYTVSVSGMTGDGAVIASIATGVVTDSAGNGNTASTSTDNGITYDATAPSVTIEQATGQADPANAGPILFEVTFSEPIDPASFTGAGVTLTGSAGATTAVVSGSGASYTVSVSGMTGDGAVIASIAAGAASDPAGNGNTASTSADNTVTYDATAPAVTVEQAPAQADPANAGPILFEVTFSEPVTGFDDTDVVLSGAAGATAAVVSGSGASYTVAVSGMTGDGAVIASIAAGAASDAAGNPSAASTSTDNSVSFDGGGPAVTIEQEATIADPTNNPSAARFRVVFSEPIVTAGFTSADVTLSGSASVGSVTLTELAPNDGTVFEVQVSVTSDGTVIASIPAGAVSDPAGNPNSASTSADNSVTVDTTPPSATIDQAPGQTDPANAGPISFRVVFSEPIDAATFGAGDIGLGGTAGATTFAVSEAAPNDGTTFDVAVGGMAGDGTVTATVLAGSVTDAAANWNLASSSTDNSVTYDTTGANVTVEQAVAQADPADASPIVFTVVFSEPVTGFDDADLTLGGTAGATTAAVTEVAPNDGTTYQAAVGGMTSAGTVTASVAAGAASDGAGNPSAASSSLDNSVTFEPAAPVVTGIARADADPTNAAEVRFAVTFSATVTGVDQSDFTLTTSGGISGASVTGVSGSGNTRTVTVSSGAGSGALRLDLSDDDSIVDGFSVALGGAGAGNGDFSGGQQYTIDRIAPLAGQLSVPAVVAGGADLTFTVVFSDNLGVSAASLATGAIQVSGPGGFTQAAELVGVSPAGDGTPRTATYRLTAPGGAWNSADNGDYSVSLAAGRVRDTVGNAAAAAALGAFTVGLSEPPALYRIHLPQVFQIGPLPWEFPYSRSR
jgi:fimbrial isopeptide formation D2 family protein/uncharacterized repeat protein (TIGR01451 family)